MDSLYIILIFFTALSFSLFLVPLMIRFAHARELFDLPDDIPQANANFANENIKINGLGRRIHTRPIPRLGGIAIVSGFFLSLLVWKMPSNMLAIYLCSLIMFFTGLVDDIRSLSAKFKLLMQIISSVAAVFFSNLQMQNLALTQIYSVSVPHVLGFLLSVFIIIGAINAINMIDGLDGLASGVVFIGISLLSYIHFISTRDINLLIVFSVPIIGAVLGFLKYNTYPSSIFMGDSGSNWLGFMVGIFILLVANNFVVTEAGGQWVLLDRIKFQDFVHVPFLSVLLCLSIPIFDTAHVIFRRLFEGKNPMFPDKRHFHHSLMRIGFTHTQSVVAVYFLMLVFGILGILPVVYPQYQLDWIPFLGLILLVVSIFYSIRLNEGFIENIMGYKNSITSEKNSVFKIPLVLKYWEHLNRYTIYVILLATPFFIGVAPKILGYASASMCVVMCISIFLKKNSYFLESFVIAISALVLLIANNSNVIWVEFLDGKYSLQNFYNGLFIWLILSTVCFFIVTFKRKYLLITPTDFLLAILPLALLLLPTHIQNEYKLNIIALRSLILFAALRTFGKRHSRFFYKIHIICIVALAWIALTTLMGLRVVY